MTGPAPHPFLVNGGHMADRIAAHGWDGTPLGAIDGWPPVLRHTVATMLPSPVPLVLLWGEAGTMLYNDAYALFAGARDSRLLGSNVREGWDEVADFNDNVMRVGLAGGTLSYRDHELTLNRSGAPERVFMNLDYSPVRDETGAAAGVLAVVVETTEACLNRRALEANARKLQFLDAVSRANAQARDPDAILATITRLTGEHLGASNCAYADMDEDGDGFTIRGNWHRTGVPSILGHYSLASFGAKAVAELGAGRPLILRDIRAELPAPAAATFDAIGVGATICMPLVKAGRLIALMAVHEHDPRDWTSYDLDLVREVTERSWAHVERVSIEADLRALNDTLEQRVDERSRQLLATEEALRHAHKMEAVGQMTGGLAHDFNNLLTAIGAAIDAIEARLSPAQAGELERYLSAAGSSVRRAAAITHRLLAFARKQTLAPEPTDANALVLDLAELVRRTVGPQIALDLATGTAPAMVRVDRNQLENALLNLCINARDAMPSGGAITIAVTDQREPVGEGSTGSVRITVRDSGAGMNSEVLARAFDPFFTTKPMGHGTGLGLSMVYGFVRQSGGQVRIRSAPGAGTTVELILPRLVAANQPAAGAAAAAGPSDAAAPARAGPVTGRVLVTEDEFFIRMMVVEALEDAGHEVVEAQDGREALELLAAGPPVDLLVTDIGLPGGLDGQQLARKARQGDPGLKVLFITGFAENSVAGPEGLEQATAVLTKPFDMAVLVARAGELLEG